MTGFYIPQDFLRNIHLMLMFSEKDRHQLILFLKNELIKKTEELIAQIKPGLKLIKDWRLRKETFIILNIAQRLCFLLKKDDPLLKKLNYHVLI